MRVEETITRSDRWSHASEASKASTPPTNSSFASAAPQRRRRGGGAGVRPRLRRRVDARDLPPARPRHRLARVPRRGARVIAQDARGYITRESQQFTTEPVLMQCGGATKRWEVAALLTLATLAGAERRRARRRRRRAVERRQPRARRRAGGGGPPRPRCRRWRLRRRRLRRRLLGRRRRLRRRGGGRRAGGRRRGVARRRQRVFARRGAVLEGGRAARATAAGEPCERAWRRRRPTSRPSEWRRRNAVRRRARRERCRPAARGARQSTACAIKLGNGGAARRPRRRRGDAAGPSAAGAGEVETAALVARDVFFFAEDSCLSSWTRRSAIARMRECISGKPERHAAKSERGNVGFAEGERHDRRGAQRRHERRDFAGTRRR